MARIFSKRAYRFHHPAGPEEVPAVTIQSNEFKDVPDWVPDSAMFKLAEKDGHVSLIESRKDELAAETGKNNRRKKNDEPQTGEAPTEESKNEESGN